MKYLILSVMISFVQYRLTCKNCDVYYLFLKHEKQEYIKLVQILEEEFEIELSIDKVWEFLAWPENLFQIIPDLEYFESIPSGPLTLGQQFIFEHKFGWRNKVKGNLEVTGFKFPTIASYDRKIILNLAKESYVPARYTDKDKKKYYEEFYEKGQIPYREFVTGENPHYEERDLWEIVLTPIQKDKTKVFFKIALPNELSFEIKTRYDLKGGPGPGGIGGFVPLGSITKTTTKESERPLVTAFHHNCRKRIKLFPKLIDGLEKHSEFEIHSYHDHKKLINKILEENKDDESNLTCLAKYAENFSDDDTALELYQKSQRTNFSSQVETDIDRIRTENQNNDKQIEYFLNKLNDDPNSFRYLVTIGDLLMDSERYDEAISYYNKILEMEDDKIYDPVLYEISTKLQKINKIDAAIKFLEKRAEHSENSGYSPKDSIQSIGEILVNNDRRKEAIPYFDRAVKYMKKGGPHSTSDMYDAYYRAKNFAILGMRDETLDAINTTIKLAWHHRHPKDMIKHDGTFKDFWDDEQFKKLVKIGFFD